MVECGKEREGSEILELNWNHYTHIHTQSILNTTAPRVRAYIIVFPPTCFLKVSVFSTKKVE